MFPRNVAIVGVGQIGGSLGMALRALGAKINAKNEQGETTLDIAKRKGRPRITTLLENAAK